MGYIWGQTIWRAHQCHNRHCSSSQKSHIVTACWCRSQQNCSRFAGQPDDPGEEKPGVDYPPIFYPLTQRGGTISISKVNHAAVVSFHPHDLCRGHNMHFSELLDCFGCKVLLILELLAPLSWQMFQSRRGDFLFILPCGCNVAHYNFSFWHL